MNLFKRSSSGFFASESVIGHLLRGCIGVVLTMWALRHQSQPVPSLAAAAGALLAFRGCPMCWTMGLIESVAQTVRRCRETGHGWLRRKKT
jgi:hypothetical protein